MLFPIIQWQKFLIVQAADDTLVQLPKGKIRGHILKSESGKPYYAFQEIPYGAPPIGKNRFQVWECLFSTDNKRFVPCHGIPKIIVSDNWTEFKNGLLQEFADTHEVTIHYITLENHPSNGMTGRFHSTIMEHFTKYTGKLKYQKSKPVQNFRLQ